MPLPQLILRKNCIVFLLLGVLIISFFLKIYFLRDLSEYDDTNKDYLVVRHIVKYQEYPMAGPWSAVSGDLRHSPLYFYFLSVFNFINNSLEFLAIINVILQTLNILIIYFIGKELFNKKTGLLAATIFGFSTLTLEQAAYIWQPWVMQPFVNLSFLLFVIAQKKKSYRSLLLGIFVFIFSAALHSSVVALTPLLIGYLLWFLVSNRASPKYSVGSVGVISLSIFVFYFPLLIYLKENKINIANSISNPFSFFPFSFVLNFLDNAVFFIGIAISNATIITLNISLITTSVVLILGTYYFLKVKDINKKKMIFLICVLVYFLLVVSLLDFKNMPIIYIITLLLYLVYLQ